LPHNYDWITSALLGSVLAATDPVAVVALLAELGASVSLATLIEGESLFNDGTAIVFFNLLEPAALKGSFDYTFAEIILTFLYVSLGGFLVGVISGTLTVRWLASVFNDALVEVSITLGSTYITFYLAEELKMSGVIAVVALGLTVSMGRTKISPEVEHFLHQFYGMAAYIANTLVFTFCGMVVTQFLTFGYTDVLYLLLIYVVMHIGRGLMALILAPLVNYKAKYPVTWREQVVMVFGGLRGTVGLALGLVIRNSFNNEDGDQLLFYIAGIVVLTLLINATSIKFLLEKLDMLTLSHDQREILYLSMSNLKNTADEEIELLKDDEFLKDTDWDTVRKYIYYPVLPREDEYSISVSEVSDNVSEAQSLLVERFLTAEKQIYQAMFEEGTLGQNAVNFMIQAVNHAHDEHRMVNVKDLNSALKPPSGLLQNLSDIPIVGIPFRKVMYANMFYAYHIALAFIKGQEKVRQLMRIRSSKEQKEYLKNKRSFNTRPSIDGDGFNFSASVAEKIHRTSCHNSDMVLRSLMLLRETRPEISLSVKTSFSIRRILDRQLKEMHEMRHNGVIDEGEEKRLKEIILLRKQHLYFKPPLVGSPSVLDLLQDSVWINELKVRDRQKVVDAMVEMAEMRKFKEDEYLTKTGDSSSSDLYLVTRGLIRIAKGDEVYDMGGIGVMYGELSLLTGLPRNADFVAETNLEVAIFPGDKMRALLESNPTAASALWKRSSRRMAETILKGSSDYGHLTTLDMRRWMNHSTFHEARSDKPKETFELEVEHVAVLLTGSCRWTVTPKGASNTDFKSKALFTQPLEAPQIIVGPELVKNVNGAKILVIHHELPSGALLDHASTIKLEDVSEDNLESVGAYLSFQQANEASFGTRGTDIKTE
jgi:NhaP-type Na+/H+ or K+/H+ antiporter/CRP-like cAMP-binding protein